MSGNRDDFNFNRKSHYNSIGMTNHLVHNNNPDLFDILLAGPPGDVALDYGCGKGRNIKNLGDLGWKKIIGVEISDANIEGSKEYLRLESQTTGKALPYEVEYYETKGDEMTGIKSDTVDMVISTITLQHIKSHTVRQNIFKEMYRVLKPKGKVRIQMSYNEGITNYFLDEYESWSNNGGGNSDVYVKDAKDLEQDLLDAGFLRVSHEIKPSFSDSGGKEWIFVEADKQ